METQKLPKLYSISEQKVNARVALGLALENDYKEIADILLVYDASK